MSMRRIGLSAIWLARIGGWQDRVFARSDLEAAEFAVQAWDKDLAAALGRRCVAVSVREEGGSASAVEFIVQAGVSVEYRARRQALDAVMEAER